MDEAVDLVDLNRASFHKPSRSEGECVTQEDEEEEEESDGAAGMKTGQSDDDSDGDSSDDDDDEGGSAYVPTQEKRELAKLAAQTLPAATKSKSPRPYDVFAKLMRQRIAEDDPRADRREVSRR